MKTTLSYLFAWVSIIYGVQSCAQSCDIYSLNKKLSYDSIYSTKNVNAFLDSLNLIGFYTLKVDSIQQNPCKVYINKGKQFERIYLSSENLNPKLLEFDENQQHFFTQNLDLYLNYIKDSLENLGRPFDKISLIPKNYINNNALVEINIEKSEKRSIDEIKFIGYEKIPKFVKRELQRKFKTYSPENITQIENELSDYSFVTTYDAPKISFTQDSTTLYLYVKRVKQSFFDGLIGFETDDENKFNIQGNVQVNLNNAFNGFEKINLNWQSGLNKSQNFDFGTHIPYIFNSRFGLNSRLKLQKQDSTFVRMEWRNGLVYQFTPNHYIGGNYNIASSNYISNDDTIDNDFNKNGFGITYFYQDLAPNRFKQNKTLIQFTTGLWKRKLSSNNGHKTDQTEIIYNLQRQQKVYKNHYIFSAIAGSNLVQEENPIENDMYYVGGFNSIRGFNQNSIITPSFNVLTFAYRYIPSDKILFETFFDAAFIESNVDATILNYQSMGLGMQFLSGFGIFNLSYAVGKTENTGFDFQNGKIHLGIKSFF